MEVCPNGRGRESATGVVLDGRRCLSGPLKRDRCADETVRRAESSPAALSRRVGAVAPNDEVTGAIPQNGERRTGAMPGVFMCIIGDLLS